MANIHVIVEQACRANDLHALKALRIDRRDILLTDDRLRAPLMLAAFYGNPSVIRYLEDQAEKLLGYDLYKIFNMRDIDGNNALSIAAKNNHTAAVVTLYELGGYDTFSANETDWIAYANMQVQTDEDYRKIAYTLQLDAKRRLTAIYKKDLYDIITDSNRKQSEILTALKKIANVDEPIYDEHPALYHAVLHGNTSGIMLLLKEGAHVTPDMVPIALDSKNEEAIGLLGANIPTDLKIINWGYLLDVLLDHAVKTNNARVILRLLPNMTVPKLQEALLYSAELGQDDVVKCLLKHGVDVNATEANHRSRTPLMLAAKKGHTSTVRILLMNGANIHPRSEHGIGLTALEYAKIYRRKECISLLLASYALEKYGNNPITKAAASSDINAILSHVKDATGLQTAINVAKETRQSKAFIKELQLRLKQRYPRSAVLPFGSLFEKRAKK